MPGTFFRLALQLSLCVRFDFLPCEISGTTAILLVRLPLPGTFFRLALQLSLCVRFGFLPCEISGTTAILLVRLLPQGFFVGKSL